MKFFLNLFEKGQILKKGFDLMEIIFSVQTIEIGQILPETVLLLSFSGLSKLLCTN